VIHRNIRRLCKTLVFALPARLFITDKFSPARGLLKKAAPLFSELAT
jgi:hypothetical protein